MSSSLPPPNFKTANGEYISSGHFFTHICGVGHPVTNIAGLRHWVRSNIISSFLSFRGPFPQTFPS